MATPTVPKNQDRVWRKIMALLQTTGNTADGPVGAAGSGRMRRKCWIYAGTPNTAATGQVAGDLVLDTSTDNVYRFISSNTFVDATTAS